MKSESEVAQSCLTLRDPVDCSLPGSSVHGIFQAKVLEWGAIAFSNLCLSINIYLILIVTSVFLAVLGLRCCGSFSPVVESSSYSLVAVCRLLIVMASLVAERRL